jgi:hypothetical protein
MDSNDKEAKDLRRKLSMEPMSKERQHFLADQLHKREAAGPEFPQSVGNRDTDNQARLQRARREGSAEWFIDESVDDSGKRRH